MAMDTLPPEQGRLSSTNGFRALFQGTDFKNIKIGAHPHPSFSNVTESCLFGEQRAQLITRLQGSVVYLERQVQGLTDAASQMMPATLQGGPTRRGDVLYPQDVEEDVRSIHNHLDLVRRSRERIREMTERLQKLYWMQEQLDMVSLARREQEFSQELGALEEHLSALCVSKDMS